jgi:hypothetical protein
MTNEFKTAYQEYAAYGTVSGDYHFSKDEQVKFMALAMMDEPANELMNDAALHALEQITYGALNVPALDLLCEATIELESSQ